MLCCSFWDSVFLPELCADRVAKNLLYIEGLAAVAAGQWHMSSDIKKQLSALQKKGQKKQVRTCVCMYICV